MYSLLIRGPCTMTVFSLFLNFVLHGILLPFFYLPICLYYSLIVKQISIIPFIFLISPLSKDLCESFIIFALSIGDCSVGLLPFDGSPLLDRLFPASLISSFSAQSVLLLNYVFNSLSKKETNTLSPGMFENAFLWHLGSTRWLTCIDISVENDFPIRNVKKSLYYLPSSISDEKFDSLSFLCEFSFIFCGSPYYLLYIHTFSVISGICQFDEKQTEFLL